MRLRPASLDRTGSVDTWSAPSVCAWPIQSLSLVVRGALFGERAWAFLGVFRREHFPPDLVLVLHCVVVAHVLGLAPCPQDRLRRERRVLRNLRRDRARDGERLAVGHDAAD